MSLKLFQEFILLRVEFLQLNLESLQLLHFFKQRRLLRTDVQLDDLHFGRVHLVPVLAALQLGLALVQFCTLLVVFLLLLFQGLLAVF